MTDRVNRSTLGCLLVFLVTIMLLLLSIQGCLIGQLIRHHADLYNRIGEVEGRLDVKE